MIDTVRRKIQSFYNRCDIYDAREDNAVPTKSLVNKELLNYLSYLSASDGRIREKEAIFISRCLGEDLSAQALHDYIVNHNTYSKSFENSVPEGFKKVVAWDLAANTHDCYQSLAYIELFRFIGKEFLSCDGEITESELNDFNTYMNTLTAYRDVQVQNKKKASPSSIKQEATKLPKGSKGIESKETLEQILAELNALTGLEAVKKDVEALAHMQEIQHLREKRGLKKIPMSNHLVFSGNPGTGKTTVARLLAKIYHKIGILSKNTVEEVDRARLVAGYVGQTAIKTQEVIEKAMGGVLFIDEAYTLAPDGDGKDYGQEAIDTLLKAMEDKRDNFVVIVAGYPGPMKKFIESNPGLRSRFNKYINFEDYTPTQLATIYQSMCGQAGYVLSVEAKTCIIEKLENLHANRSANFANAREVRNLFEKAVVKQASRLFELKNPSNEQLCELTVSDVM